MGDDEQWADVAPGARRRRVEAGEAAGEALQLPGGLQLVETAECCHNALAYLPTLSVTFHQLDVLMDLLSPAHSLDPRVHWHNTITRLALITRMSFSSLTQRHQHRRGVRANKRQ